MRCIDEERNPLIDEAANWLASTPRRQRDQTAVPLLKERLGLSTSEACRAVAAASMILAKAV